MKRAAPDPADTAEKMKAADNRQRHLDTIRQAFTDAFAAKCTLRHIGLYCYDEGTFHAFIKLLDGSDVSQAQEGGLAEEMREFILGKLEFHGRGQREAVTLDLEFDYANKPRNPVPFDHKQRWERAVLAAEEAHRHLDDIVTLFTERFGEVSPLDYFHIGGGLDRRFGVSIFFTRHIDIAEAERSGLDEKMMDYVYELLAKFGRGERAELDVEFEFDSRENVDLNFEGNYSLRLR